MYDIDNSFLKGVWYVGGESIAGANNDLKIVDGVINGTESNISKGSRSVVNLKKRKKRGNASGAEVPREDNEDKSTNVKGEKRTQSVKK